MIIISVELFQKYRPVNREEINKRLEQAGNMFRVQVFYGGTGATNAAGARYNLGIDNREVFYRNASGTTSRINLSYPYLQDDLIRLGIYYGVNGIKKYVEVRPSRWTSMTVSMEYITSSGNLLIRTGKLYYSQSEVQMYRITDGCYFFSTNGDKWQADEDLYIYEVVGFFRGGR